MKATFIAVNKADYLNPSITYNDSNGYTPTFIKIKDLRKYILKKYKTLKGWFYTTIDGKDDTFLDEEAPIRRGIYPIETPFSLKMKNKIILPLWSDGKVWVKIPEFSRYLASNEGDILTIKTGNSTKGVTAGHYLKASLIRDDQTVSKMEYVHNLICRSFHGPKPGKNYVVMHGDDNKENNNEKNLKWGTQSQNIKDVWIARRKGLSMENLIVKLDSSLDKHKDLVGFINTVSVEEGFINGLSSFINKQINNVVETLSEFSLSTVMGNPSETKQLQSDLRSINAIIKNGRFSEVESRLAPVTIGLGVNLITLNSKLKENNTNLDKILISSLQDMNRLLSRVISDNDFRSSFKPKTSMFTEINKITSLVESNLREVISSNSNTDRLPVNKLIPNLSSLQVLATDTVMLSKSVSVKTMKDVDSLVTEIKEKTNILHMYIEDNGKDFKITKSSLDALATGLETNARLVSVAMTNYNLVNQQVGMVNNLIKIVK